MRVFKCNVCGNIVINVNDGGGTMKCCEKQMEELAINNAGNAALHMPDVEERGRNIRISIGKSMMHPMEREHYISFIIIEGEGEFIVKYLPRTKSPVLDFELPSGFVVSAVYAYCNLHGLWKISL